MIEHPPMSYIVDVCRRCGRIARWPGCEHWQKHDDWTMAVKVTLPEGERDKLRVQMNALSEDES